MEQHEFQNRMIAGISDLTAKMNMLVGADGTNGRFKEVEDEVNALKQAHSEKRGASGLLMLLIGSGASLGGGVVGAVATAIFNHLFR